MNAFEKLFIARTLLSINQKEAAEQAGIHPASLSILERGEKKYIPTEYLHFLHTKGIDINWIFGDSNSTNAVFRHDAVIPKTEAHTGTRLHPLLPDFELKEILEELKKLNINLSLAQSSIPHFYGN